MKTIKRILLMGSPCEIPRWMSKVSVRYFLYHCPQQLLAVGLRKKAPKPKPLITGSQMTLLLAFAQHHTDVVALKDNIVDVSADGYSEP